jgi:hypothetical protein
VTPAAVSGLPHKSPNVLPLLKRMDEPMLMWWRRPCRRRDTAPVLSVRRSERASPRSELIPAPADIALTPVAVWLRPASSVLCGSPDRPAGAAVTPGQGCGMPACPVALVTETAGLERVTDRPEDGEAPGDVPFA